MVKITTIIMCIFISAIAIDLSIPNAMSQEACIVPTVAGNTDFKEGWTSENGCICAGVAPNIIKSLSEEETLPRNSSTTVWVDSGGKACPPYNWTISGTGFHFESATGPTTATTTKDLQSLSVWADDTACGAGKVSVSDSCNVTHSVEIRSQNGDWFIIEDISCGTLDPGGCTCYSEYCCIQGEYRYCDIWLGGNLLGTLWHPSGNCTKYPCTPYTKNYCYCVGFYPKKYHVGIISKIKYKWICQPPVSE